MGHIVIPEWRPPRTRPVDTTGQSTGGGHGGGKPADLQVNSIGYERVIPILYGGPERMAGLLYCLATPKTGAHAGHLIYCNILCEGEVEEISGFELDNNPIPIHVQITAYRGTQVQNVDPWLAAVIPGFNEPMRGIAYYVAKIRSGVNATGFPNVTALVKGLKVADPRTTFYHVNKDIETGWVDSAPAPVYTANAGPARDGSNTAHRLANPTPLVPRSSSWTWAVPNDSLSRTVSISVNKNPAADYLAGLAVEYLGGVTPKTNLFSLNLVTGALVSVAGAGATTHLVEHPGHWEVLLTMANNTTGNLSFKLSLFPSV